MKTTLRVWLPFVVAALLMAATAFAGTVLTWVLMLAAIGFILDGATLLWSRSGTSMGQHRQ
jgi:ABC-type transport system involved in cytochrome bd biosynthesis fused ATPase/permease subunit